jgi:hypothetical protein
MWHYTNHTVQEHKETRKRQTLKIVIAERETHNKGNIATFLYQQPDYTCLITGRFGHQLSSLQKIKCQFGEEEGSTTQSKEMLRETELWTWSTIKLPWSRSHVALNAGTVVQTEVNIVQQILLQVLIWTHFVKTENRKQPTITEQEVTSTMWHATYLDPEN